MKDGSGHCLCRAVRYKFDTDAVLWRAHCHCESCRRACSAPFTTWFGVRESAWRWRGTPPAVYQSSPGAMRYFCPVCGAQMAYRTAERPDQIDGLAATLADHGDFSPELHEHWDEHLSWISLADDLPRDRARSVRTDPSDRGEGKGDGTASLA